MIWKILAYFGVQYVVLVHHDKEHKLRRAYRLGEKWFAHPYLSDTRAELLPHGELIGKCYLESWIPVTAKMQQLFNQSKGGGE